MSGTSLFRAFYQCERGAVAVDWVVLAAACVGLGVGATNVVSNAMKQLTYEIRAQLQTDLTRNPFDLQQTCAYIFIDPNADPLAAEAYSQETLQNCTVGASVAVADANADSSGTSRTVIITDGL